MSSSNLHLERSRNNFDLLRLFAALLVLFSHSYDLWNMRAREPLRWLISGRHLFSTFGLIFFFAMSGFLVTHSLLHSSTTKEYLFKRFLRIWPAYTVCNIVCVLTVGLFFTTLPAMQFLLHPQTIAYVAKNALLINATMSLPGVFNGASVNASIWTIPLETKLYVILMVLYLVGIFKHKFVLVLLYIGLLFLKCYTSYFAFTNVAGLNLSGFHGLSDYFLGGAICYLYKDRLPFRFVIWLSLFAAWVAALNFAPRFTHLAESPFLVYSVIYFGCNIPKIPFPRADLSYGTYLYAYPVQQSVKYIFYGQLNFAAYNIVVIAITLLLAAGSWFVVEKRALALKRVVARRKLPDQLPQQPHNEADKHE